MELAEQLLLILAILAEQQLLILAILAEQQLEWGLVVLLVHHKRNRIGHSAVAMYRIFYKS